MADKEKKKKKKAAKEEPPPPPPAPEPPPPEPTPPATPSKASTRPSSRGSRGSKRSAKRSESNVFSLFTQGQIAEYKEGFSFIDADKDGIISKSDLRSTFNQIGKIVAEKELEEMVSEAVGPINFTQFLLMFAKRMSGQADEDSVVVAAFRTFDEEGIIDGEKLKTALMSFGDKFTEKEVDNAYAEFTIDENGNIDTEDLIELLVGEQKEEDDL